MRGHQQGTLLSDGRWRIVLTLTREDGAKKAKTFTATTQREVQEKVRKWQAKNGRKAHDPHTMVELLEECKANRWGNLAKNTKEQYNRYGGMAADRFGGLKDIRGLTTPMIAAWVRVLSDDEHAGRHAQLGRNVLRIMLKHAAELGWRANEPIWEVRLTKSPAPTPKRRLTFHEAKTVIEAEPIPERKLFWWTLLETGMRPIEVTLLERSNILYTQDCWWVQGGVKTDAGKNRVVMISDKLGGALLDAAPDEGRIFKLRFDDGPTRKTVGKFWRNSCKNAGVVETNLYQLRKLRVSLWRAAGVADDIVTRMVGHTKIRTTIENYDEVTRERIKQSLEGKS